MKKSIIFALMFLQNTVAFGCSNPSDGGKPMPSQGTVPAPVKNEISKASDAAEIKEEIAPQQEDFLEVEPMPAKGESTVPKVENAPVKEELAKEETLALETVADRKIKELTRLLSSRAASTFELSEADSSSCRNGNRIGRGLGNRFVEKLGGDCEALQKVDLFAVFPKGEGKLINRCKDLGLLEAQTESIRSAEHCIVPSSDGLAIYERCWSLIVEGINKSEGRFVSWVDESGEVQRFFDASFEHVLSTEIPRIHKLNYTQKLNCIEGALGAWKARK